jgi:hypothetical protein
MSLIKHETLIKVCCASQLLNLSESALLKGSAGTAILTRVPQGKRISFILEEIIEYKAELISASQQRKFPKAKMLKLVA